MNIELYVLIIVTALLSSVLTAIMLGIVFKFHIAPQLNQQIETLACELEEKLDQHIKQAGQQFREETHQGFSKAVTDALPLFRAELQTGFEETAEAMLPKFRHEVTEGFQDAVKEMLPEFRREMHTGFKEIPKELLPFLREEIEGDLKEIITSVARGDFVDKAAKRMVQTGSSLVETGLTLLKSSRFGEERRR
jgi:DNA anti-recombination protein RmuC